ncbi:MAG: NAD(P)H-dependent glycerol-3-phosphate dehydrogenase [Pseudomonadota bacterium]
MAGNVTVLGSGAWGSALACIAARAGHSVTIWGKTAETVDEINSGHTNKKYLDNLRLEDSVQATNDIQTAMGNADIIVLSVPAQALSSTLEQIKPQTEKTTFIATCKGIDRQTGHLPHELITTAFPDNPVAALSGPSFASDVVSGLPTAVTIASANPELSAELSTAFSTSTFRCYASGDLKGVELGGALKNVLALAVGAARGMRLGASAEAALIARGFAEVSRLAVKLGANPETLTGLSGLGDLVLTCSSPQSRNFSYGMAMGRGESLEGLKLAEGAFTAGIALKLAGESGIEVPITQAIVNVLENRTTAHEAVQQLLTRPLKREN